MAARVDRSRFPFLSFLPFLNGFLEEIHSAVVPFPTTVLNFQGHLHRHLNSVFDIFRIPIGNHLKVGILYVHKITQHSIVHICIWDSAELTCRNSSWPPLFFAKTSAFEYPNMATKSSEQKMVLRSGRTFTARKLRSANRNRNVIKEQTLE